MAKEVRNLQKEALEKIKDKKKREIIVEEKKKKRKLNIKLFF